MPTIRCLILLILSAAGATACQKTIHEVRAPLPGAEAHHAEADCAARPVTRAGIALQRTA
jgi:hypothetical protein